MVIKCIQFDLDRGVVDVDFANNKTIASCDIVGLCEVGGEQKRTENPKNALHFDESLKHMRKTDEPVGD